MVILMPFCFPVFVACKCEELFNNIAHRNLAIQFHLECSYTCLTYYEYHRAKQHLQTARDLLGLDVNMTGGQYDEKTDDGCVQLIEGWINSNTMMEAVQDERVDRKCE